ncbi:hypothetical protein EIN_523790 [Entamoeba invadens IP1]|uniref:Translation initiation factor beta propellor-like domain-containing protein n=1 Tax=Entamoeba invadens IP1 TaxID=370355 RepID=A0A0A1UBC6_ENTIV|nr:hypothetical protein EIN_523790 [Entamoeba invadens IP1]ELP92481.1 hypothetical protein EIN_523790 [Entamoeba invadens IP1]|eukprot:XP_004259252.1 hypothetical protein EIN_523790 [Entamoeba invadens IP1]
MSISQPTLKLRHPFYVIHKDAGVEVHTPTNSHIFPTSQNCLVEESQELIILQNASTLEIYDYNLTKKYDLKIEYIDRLTLSKKYLHILQVPPASNKEGFVREPTMYYLLDLKKDCYNLIFSRKLQSIPSAWPICSFKNNIIALPDQSGVSYFNYNPFLKTEFTKTQVNTSQIDHDDLIGVKFIEFSPISDDLLFAAFFPEKQRFPASIELYSKQIGKKAQLINTISSLNGTSVIFKWCPMGHLVLAITSTEFDETGHSYYGQSSLYSLFVPNISGKPPQFVPNPKVFKSPTNNIYTRALVMAQYQDAQFSPSGDTLSIISGLQPAEVSVLSTLSFDELFHRQNVFANSSIFSFNSQFLAIGGFGNLPGDVEIFETKSFLRVAKFSSQCTTEWMWSNDNASIICAHCWPRRHFDNKIERFGIDGELIEKIEVVPRGITVFGEKEMRDLVFKFIEYKDEGAIYVTPKKK